MSSQLPPFLQEVSTTISSTKLELVGTLQVLVLILCLNFWALLSSISLSSATSTWLDVLGLQWYWLSSSLDLTGSTALSVGHVWAIHLCCSLLCLSTSLSISGTATDVIHSIAWPHLFLRFDVCPGRISTMSCSSQLAGMVSGQCSELCGSLHGFMAISIQQISFLRKFLVIILLFIGVFSLLERILLAAIQYRQGPVTAMLHGFTQLIADGIKIYSKFSLDVLAWSAGIFVLGITFTTYVGLSMLVYCGGLLSALTSDIDMLLFLALSGLLGCLCVVPMVIATNRYSSIGCLRQLRALILADIGLDTGLVLLALLFVTLDSGANAMTIAPNWLVFMLIFIPLFVLVLISSARAPFDLPEAESELVSGTLTEVGGTAFSLCLLLDYLEVLTWSTIMAILVVGLSLSTMVVLGLILVSYIGRLLLCRILLTDVPRLLFLVLLWILGILLNIHEREQHVNFHVANSRW